MHTRKLDELYTSRGELNLFGAIIKHSQGMTPPLHDIFEKEVFPCIDRDIPASSYAGVNIARLKTLFNSIKKRNLISNADFNASYRKPITESIERFYEEEIGIKQALWGAWYKTEDEEDVYESLCEATFTDTELNTLKYILLKEDALPEAIAFALNIFAGFTITEAMSARIRDISLDSEGNINIHTMGSFPKTTKENASDTRPRFITVPSGLDDLLIVIREKANNPDTFIAEKGGSYCHIQDLHFYARDILKNDLCIDERRLSKTENDILISSHSFARERSSAYLMGRRTFATTLYGKGEGPDEINYLMGFAPEEEINEEGDESNI